MMMNSRLTEAQRREIAVERARGVPAQDVAARFGVSRQTIHATVRAGQDARPAGDVRSRVLSLRVSDRDMRSFDAAVSRHGLGRSEAMKRMVRAVGGLLALDDGATEGLQQLQAAINRVGGNVNQIARACNEARLRGQPLPYTAGSHAEVREALALVFEVSRQVRAMAQSRRAQLDVAIGVAFKGGGGDEA